MSGASSLGAFAYLFNSTSAFSVFLFPFSIRLCVFWCLPLIPVAALLSYCASLVIIRLTELVNLDLEREQLLPEQPAEVDVLALVQHSASTLQGGSLMHMATLYSCFLCVVTMTLVSADSAKLVIGEEHESVFICAIAIAVALMNRLSFECVQVLHVFMMLCRLGYCGLRVFTVVSQGDMQTEVWMFMPCLASAFFYQLSLPAVLAAYNRAPSTHINMQRAVIGAALAGNIVLLWGMYTVTPVQPGKHAHLAIHLLYTVSKVASPQIYWQAISRILVTWVADSSFEQAEKKHPRAVSATQTFLHIPVYVLALVLAHYRLQDYLMSFYAWMPVATALVYLSVSCAYSAELSAWAKKELEVPRALTSVDVFVLRLVFAVLSVGGFINLYLTGWMQHASALIICCAVLLAVLVMKLVSRLGS